MQICRFIIVCLVMVVVSACSNYGAVQLPPDRISYNASLQYSDNQQMLLNIVRLRYTDTPYFLSVSNVVSQFSYSKSLDLSLNNPAPPPALSVTADGNISLSESPTITYTPLQGQEYVTKLLTPIDLSVIYMLIRAGWSADKVLRILVQRLGPLDNAVLASRSISSHLPKFKKFQEFSLALRAVEYTDNLTVKPDVINNKFCLKLTIDDYNQLTPPQRSFFAKIGITREFPSLWIVSWPTEQPHEFYAQTRTVLGLFNYLSKSVDLPEKDIEEERVKMSYEMNGKPFDWRQVTIGHMHVRTCRERPANGRLAVRYHDNWFYIADNDFESKETLSILSVIAGIYQGEVKSFLPIFTVS